MQNYQYLFCLNTKKKKKTLIFWSNNKNHYHGVDVISSVTVVITTK